MMSSSSLLLLLLSAAAAPLLAAAQDVWYAHGATFSAATDSCTKQRCNQFGCFVGTPYTLPWWAVADGQDLINHYVSPSLMRDSICTKMIPPNVPPLGRIAQSRYVYPQQIRISTDEYGVTPPALTFCAFDAPGGDPRYVPQEARPDPTPAINAFNANSAYAAALVTAILTNSNFVEYAAANGIPSESVDPTSGIRFSWFKRLDLNDCLDALINYACARAMPASQTQFEGGFGREMCMSIPNSCHPDIILPTSVPVTPALKPFAMEGSDRIAVFSNQVPQVCAALPANQNYLLVTIPQTPYDWAALGVSPTPAPAASTTDVATSEPLVPPTSALPTSTPVPSSSVPAHYIGTAVLIASVLTTTATFMQ